MAINEIECGSGSISFKCWSAEVDDLQELYNKIKTEADQLNIEDELPGFHDYDIEDGLIRGYYSGVVPFEVEHLVDGQTTKTLFKRIESCEFFLTPTSLFTKGKAGPMRGLSHDLSVFSGHCVEPIEFDFDEMSLLQECMSEVKAIVVRNPKDKDVRTARLTGRIEDYSEYNVLDPKNHGIDNVSGVADTPIGPITITVNKNGTLRLKVKKGLIILVEHLEWILALIQEERRPNPAINEEQTSNENIPHHTMPETQNDTERQMEEKTLRPSLLGVLRQGESGERRTTRERSVDSLHAANAKELEQKEACSNA